jgi:hypothetical protein
LFKANWANWPDALLTIESIQAVIVLPNGGVFRGAYFPRAIGAKMVRPCGLAEIPGFNVENLGERTSRAHCLIKMRTDKRCSVTAVMLT